MSIDLTVYFDYTCRYAYRFTKVLNSVRAERDDIRVTWQFFSIEQGPARDKGFGDSWSVWDQPLDYVGPFRKPHTRSLLPFLAAHVVREEAADRFEAFHAALYDLLHQQRGDASAPQNILAVAEQVGVDLSHVDWNDQQTGRDALKASHQAARALGIFGTPTVIINGSTPTYLKLADIPPADEQSALLDDLAKLATLRPYLMEFKQAG